MEPAFESAENKGEIEVSDKATPKQIFQHIQDKFKTDKNGL